MLTHVFSNAFQMPVMDLLGVSVDLPNSYRLTPLMLAAQGHQYQKLSLLFQDGKAGKASLIQLNVGNLD